MYAKWATGVSEDPRLTFMFLIHLAQVNDCYVGSLILFTEMSPSFLPENPSISSFNSQMMLVSAGKHGIHRHKEDRDR